MKKNRQIKEKRSTAAAVTEAVPLIEFKDISKRFGEKQVLNGIDLTIHQREITTIIGKSGTGKSVLLKHIIGLMRPDSGEIFFKGQKSSSLRGKALMTHIRQMSYMFQNNALFDSMTVFDNVAFPLRQTTALGEREIEKRVMALLEKTDLTEFIRQYPSELSGGMQKRVAFSRALVTNPSIVLFDEPTTGQDLIRRNAILSMIAEYKEKFGFTAVIISHDLPDVLFISNRVLILHEGKIIFQGSPEALDTFQHPYVDEFIHSLETFQEHMPGIYSQRNFKMRYKAVLKSNRSETRFVVAIFAISMFKDLCRQIGHSTAHSLVKELGQRITRHFDAVGGFSTRQRRSRFMTVLPFSNLEEANALMAAFIAELKEKGFDYLNKQNRYKNNHTETAHKVTVIAGLAEGKNATEGIDDVLKKARETLFEIGDFQCVKGECSLS